MNCNFRAFVEEDQINSNKNAIYQVVDNPPALENPYETIKEVQEYDVKKDITINVNESSFNEKETYNTLTLT